MQGKFVLDKNWHKRKNEVKRICLLGESNPEPLVSENLFWTKLGTKERMKLKGSRKSAIMNFFSCTVSKQKRLVGPLSILINLDTYFI